MLNLTRQLKNIENQIIKNTQRATNRALKRVGAQLLNSTVKTLASGIKTGEGTLKTTQKLLKKRILYLNSRRRDGVFIRHRKKTFIALRHLKYKAFKTQKDKSLKISVAGLRLELKNHFLIKTKTGELKPATRDKDLRHPLLTYGHFNNIYIVNSVEITGGMILENVKSMSIDKTKILNNFEKIFKETLAYLSKK